MLGIQKTLIKLSDGQIREIVSSESNLSETITDEMAIPSYTHKNPLIRWLMWQRLHRVIEIANIDASMSVLDFGCGIGLLFPTLNSMCADLFAFDLYPQYAKGFSEANNYGVIFIDELNDLDDHSLDVVIAADVLEHIKDIQFYISLFAEKIKPRGKLIVSGPTENLIYKLGRKAAGWGDKGDYHLTNIYAIRSMILEHTFTQIDRRTIPFSVPPHLFHVYKFMNEGQ